MGLGPKILFKNMGLNLLSSKFLFQWWGVPGVIVRRLAFFGAPILLINILWRLQDPSAASKFGLEPLPVSSPQCIDWFCGQKGLLRGFESSGYVSAGYDLLQNRETQNLMTARGFLTSASD